MANPKNKTISIEEWVAIVQSKRVYDGYVDTIGRTKCDWIIVPANKPEKPYPSTLSQIDSTFFNKYYRVQIFANNKKESRVLIDALTEDMVRNAITEVNVYNREKTVHVDYGKTIKLTENGKIDVKIDRANWTITVSVSEPKREYAKGTNSLEFQNGGPFTFSFQNLTEGYLGEKAAYSIQKSLDILEPEVQEKDSYELSDSSVVGMVWILVDNVISFGTKFGKTKAWNKSSKSVSWLLASKGLYDTHESYKKNEISGEEAFIDYSSSASGFFGIYGIPVTLAAEMAKYIRDQDFYQEFRIWLSNKTGSNYKSSENR